MRAQGQDALQGTHAVGITDETIEILERELNALILATAEKIARTRDLIAKLDELLASGSNAAARRTGRKT